MSPAPRHHQDATAPRRRWHRFLRLWLRATLIGNAALAALVVGAGVTAHIWVSASEENLQRGVEAATHYVLTPAGLIQEYGASPAALRPLVRLIESVVVDGARLGPDRPAHRYWRGRVLMAMPAVYKELGLEDERLDRGRRAIAELAALAAEFPANTDYRRRTAVAHDLHAVDLASLGRHDEAIVHWRQQYDIAAGLLAEQPEYWRWRWYQAGASVGIGASLIALNRDGARPHLELARTLGAALCAEAGNEQHASACKIATRAAALLAGGAG